MAPATVVLDTAPLVTGVNLSSLGVSRFVTIPEVIAEVRDSWSRRNLEFNSPQNLEIKTPSEESIKTVMAFARKTGDFASLSVTDLKVLALTFMLDKEAHGGKTDHLRLEPVRTSGSATVLVGGRIASMAGGGSSKGGQKKESTSGEAKDKDSTKETETETEPSSEPAVVEALASSSASTPSATDHFTAAPDTSALDELAESAEALDLSDEDEEEDEEEEEKESGDDLGEEDGANASQDTQNGGADPADESKEEDEDEDEEDDDDGGGWITPKNVAKHKARDMGVSGKAAPKAEEVPVAVITNDFAMQNVVMQMKLRLYSVDGVVIRRVKTWVLRCHACFKITSDMDKRFCPSCGNNTLMRTSCQIQDDGTMRVFLKKNFQYNNRGTRYTVPPPKGGKQSASDLVFAEDDPNYQRRLKEHGRMLKNLAKSSPDPFSPEYVPSFLLGAGGNTTGGSRAVQLGGPRIGYGRSNPNEARKVTGKKKKR